MNTRRNYPLLLVSQFLSAFGDNMMLAIILGPVMLAFKEGRVTASEQSFQNIFYTSLLFVPFVFVAPLAGYLNDRFPKTRWLLGGNLVKLAGAGLAGLSLVAGGPLLAVGYLIVGVGACIYSPAKYGILPEILPSERLVKANGTVEFLTLVAILTGNIGGAMLVDNVPLGVCYGAVMAVYAASLLCNLLMTATPSYPQVQFRTTLAEFVANGRELMGSPRLVRVLMGTGLFWLCGAIKKMNFQPWGQQVLVLKTMTQIALLGLWLSLGVMVGSVLAGLWYRTGDLRATRRYGWLMAAFVALLSSVAWWMHHGLAHPLALVIPGLICTGVAGGLFLIPLNAALQSECHQGRLGKTIATQNFIENIAMLGGSVVAWLNVRVGFDPTQLLLVLAVVVALGAACLRIPEKSPKTNSR